ncbi:hypothetical protein GW17_00060875 [Ensete ventricosum]|nr:hypothetical protein GW17_00060875 [Ensete ventricosum]
MPLQAPAMPAGGRACWRLPLQGGFGRGRSPPYRAPWPQPSAPCNRPDRGWPALLGGWPPLLLAVIATNA